MAELVFGWDSLWGAYKGMPPTSQNDILRQLDDTEGGWCGFVARWSPKVQVQILTNAPAEIVRELYNSNALSPKAVIDLGVSPNQVRVLDRRTRHELSTA